MTFNFQSLNIFKMTVFTFYISYDGEVSFPSYSYIES